jgi:hypothetical protein
MSKNLCRNCDTPTDHPQEVCPECYRDPKTNICTDCGKHFAGIPYPFVCGMCHRKSLLEKDLIKQVVWIVEEEGTLGSGNTKLLQSALESCNIPTLSVSPKYFTDELPEIEGEVPENAALVYYGSTTLRDKLVTAGEPGVFFVPSRFTFRALLEEYGEELLNHDSKVLSIRKFLSKGGDPEESLFIRPASDSKSLVGAVQTRAEWEEAIRISMNNTRGPSNGTLIQVASPKNVEFEWRVFVVAGKAVAASQYRAHGYLNLSPDVPQKVLDYSEQMAEKYQPAEAFVMDVCELSRDGSLRVVETNCMNCSGFYLSDVKEVVLAVTELIER